jgi:hypothetical protein
MRPHVEADARRERGGAHVVEEDERPDQARGHRRQHAAYRQVADIAQVGLEDCFDRGGHGAGSGWVEDAVILLVCGG